MSHHTSPNRAVPSRRISLRKSDREMKDRNQELRLLRGRRAATDVIVNQQLVRRKLVGQEKNRHYMNYG